MSSCVGFHLLLRILPLLLLFRLYQTGADEKASDCLFVSHQRGQDSPLCGSSVQPCQTLTKALLMVSDGGKICLDGRNSESHPYGCLPMNGSEDVNMDPINKSMIIQGWFSNAHISCKLYGLGFKSARNRTLNLTLSHLVFHNNGVILRNVSCSNTVVSSCRFVNCREAVVIEQEPSNFCRKSSLVITDTEFLYNGISVFAHLFNNSLTVNISRCIFQGKVGRFKIIDDDRNMTGAVYIKSKTVKNRVYVFGFITDSIFRELGHDNNDFALSVRVYDYYSTGYLRLLNTTFLNNENAVLVYGGFDVQMIQVMINSTYGYAVLSGAPPKVRPSVVGVKVFLNQCTLRNNRVGIRMAVLTCLGLLCLTSSKELVVKNSLFLGGNETRGTGGAIRFRVSNDANFPRPDFIEARMLLENVTFQGLHNCALYVGMQKNVKGLISVRNCKFRNNSQFVSQLDERATVQIEFKDENPPKCRQQKWKKVKKFAQSKTSQIPVIFENSIFENNVGISAALNFLNGTLPLETVLLRITKD